MRASKRTVVINMTELSDRISVWVTKGCNQHCKYCFYDGTGIWEAHENMTIKTAKEVCKFINSGLAKMVSFFGGEPLVNWPVMKFILENSKGRGVSYYVTTNGTLLTPDIFRTLAKYRVGNSAEHGVADAEGRLQKPPRRPKKGLPAP